MITIKKMLAVLAAAGFALSALAGQSFGRNDGTRKIGLSESAVILGVTVPPGTYTLSWARERESAEVRIEIARGRSVVAKGKGHWIETEKPSAYESLVYRPDANGAAGLAEIRFKGSADAILVDAGTAVADARAESK